MNDLWTDLLDLRGTLFYLGGLALAVATTVHVLLTKRDVSSAVGWIALAWFAPFFGTASYAMLGINRVRARARSARPDRSRLPRTTTLPEPGHLRALTRGIDRITRSPMAPGNAVTTYDNGDQAYPAMLAAIAAARHSIGLSSYIFRNDTWGGRFIEALIGAHARGVATRVLIDGIGGNWLTSPAYHRLRRAGVPAARFLHSSLPWRMPFLNLRSHKKILVIDGSTGFTGGLNLADENVLALHPPHPVQDTHFHLAGPVVAQLTAAFAQDWRFAHAEDLTGTAWFPNIPTPDIPTPDTPTPDIPIPGVPNTGEAQARVIESGPDEDIEKVEFAVLQAIACAEARIVVMTPYFLPDERLVTALSLAAMRGVAVDVVVPARSNRVVVDWGTRANSGPLLRDGVRIWRSPAPFHHTKLMVVDDDWCLIGSANWDMRSFRLNFELCVEVHDRTLAQTLAALASANQSAEMTEAELAARSLPIRLRDAASRLLLPYL